MDTTLERITTLLVSAYQAGHGLGLVFDYDGTLAPIAARPRLAALAPELRASLEDLATLPGVVVGVISGRALADVKEMIGLPGLWYGGTSGLEIEIDGNVLEHPDLNVFKERVAVAEESLREVIASVPGAWIERKPVGLTIHYRDAAAGRVPELRQAVQRLLGPAAPSWRILDGLMAIEVTPAEGWTKSKALRSICEARGRGVIPLYAGDHANDADALEAAETMGGIAIGVGPEAPAASYHLPGPEAVSALVSRLAAALKGKQTS